MSDIGYPARQESPAPEPSLSPRESLALISEQRDSAVRSLRPHAAPMLASWGASWLLGFGAFWLAAARAPVVPSWGAGMVLGVLSVLAAIVTARQVMRGRGVTGPSRTMGARYGWAWVLGWAGVYAFNFGLMHDGLPGRLESVVWPGSCVLLAGVFYLAGGVIWQDPVSYGLGAWMLAVAAGGMFAGAPANFAVMALGGGGGLLAAAAAAELRVRRLRTAR
jgi:hypothetical protein